MKTAARRRTTSLSILLLLALSCLACTGARSNTIEGGEGIGGPEDPPDAHDVLDQDARAAIEAVAVARHASPSGAQEAYLELAARFDGTPAGDIANILAAAVQPERDPAAFGDYARNEDLLPPVRSLAAAYHALSLARAGERAEALDTLEQNHLTKAPSPFLHPADRVPVLVLLSASRQASERGADAMVALSWLFEVGGEDVRRYAKARGFATCRALDPEQRDGLADASRDDFIAGLCGAARARAALEGGALDESARAELAGQLGALRSKLERIDAADLSDAITTRLAASDGPQALRVGALLPLTGADRRVGQRALDGLLLAQETFRVSATPRITLVIHDTKSTDAGAKEGVARLSGLGVIAIIGPLSNTEARAAAADTKAVPMIALCLDDTVSQTGASVFRFFIDSTREVDALFARAASVDRRRLAFLYPDLPLGRGMVAIVEDAAARHGFELVLAEPYQPGSKNFSNIAKRVKRKKADVVFIPDVASRVSLLMPFLAAEQMWCAPLDAGDPAEGRHHMTCLGNVTWLQPALLSDGDTYFDGALIAAGYTDLSPASRHERFAREHRAMIGAEPNLFSAYAYDAMKLLHVAILERGLNRPGLITRGLSRLDDVEGLTGRLTISEGGEIAATPLLIEVRDDAFKIAPAPDTARVSP